MQEIPKNIEYLAISGGGIKALFATGVMIGLNIIGVLTRIKGITGTSAGSIVACLYALGYEPKDIATIGCGLNFSLVFDRIDPIKTLTQGYASKHTKFRQMLMKLISDKTDGDPNISLSDLYKRSSIHLVFNTLCKETGQRVKLDHIDFPDLPLQKAVRMSCCIPLVFPAVKWKEFTYLDGACRVNYPMDVFPIEKTLGIRLGIRGECRFKLPKANTGLLGELTNSMMEMVETVLYLSELTGEEIENQMLKGIKFREISGSVGNISVLSLDMSNEEKIQCVLRGLQSVINFIQDPTPKTLEEHAKFNASTE